MNRISIAALFVTSTFIAAPAFSADLCASNLQQVKDDLATMTATSTTSKKDIQTLQASATTAQAKGDDKTCIADSTQALKIIDDNKKGGAAGS